MSPGLDTPGASPVVSEPNIQKDPMIGDVPMPTQTIEPPPPPTTVPPHPLTTEPPPSPTIEPPLSPTIEPPPSPIIEPSPPPTIEPQTPSLINSTMKEGVKKAPACTGKKRHVIYLPCLPCDYKLNYPRRRRPPKEAAQSSGSTATQEEAVQIDTVEEEHIPKKRKV